MEEYNKVVGDHILISYYVRYDVLTEMINAEFYNSNCEEVNVFIDAYSMIKSIYKLDTSQFIDYYSITSCIINACAHYRNFFWTRYKVTSKIWIVFSEMTQSIFEARQFYPDYGNIFTDSINGPMNQMIKANMDILNMMCPYIPDVKFIYSQYEPGLVFGRIDSSEYGVNTTKHIGTNVPSFIISKDPWNLQPVSQSNKIYMIRPIKKNGQDLSVMISNKTVMAYYSALRKVKYFPGNIGPEYLPFIIAATRFPERNIKSLHNISSIMKALSSALELNRIPSGNIIYDIDGLCNEINSIIGNIKSYNIKLRMEAIGYNRCLYRYMMSPMIDDISIDNLHDPDSVKRINETYFSKVPLDIMSL